MAERLNRTAVVTGSTSGIGLGIATALAGAGYDIVTNSYTDEDADREQAAELGRAHGVEARFISADMSKGGDCRRLVEEAGEMNGGVSVLVNNAGIQFVAPIEDFPTEKWDAILAINLSSAFHTAAAAVPQMKRLGWGRVINLASAHGLTASPYKSAYVAAKHGMVGLSKVIALETAREPITANTICPGYVLTPLVEKQIPEQMKEHGMGRDEVIEKVMLERQPTREFATPEQIGALAVFLCTDAAAQITGTEISVDGGWTAM